MNKSIPALPALVLGMCVVVAAADATPTLKDVLARVGDYVLRYETELSAIVAEEHYAQDVQDSNTRGRSGPMHRELKSDLLMVRAEGRDGYGFVQFRDVYQVNGDAVRDRSERLLKLFVTPTLTAQNQAREIMQESSRYNIGRVERNVNVPVLALSFLHPRYHSRFKFTMDAEGAGVPRGMPKAATFSLSVDVRVLNFKEVGDPPLVDSRDRSRPARTNGRAWVEPDTGRILMTELNIDTATVDSTIQVSYQSEPVVGFLVPVEMREQYFMPKLSYRVTGTATYGNFRQFVVQTNEAIAPPKDQP